MHTRSLLWSPDQGPSEASAKHEMWIINWQAYEKSIALCEPLLERNFSLKTVTLRNYPSWYPIKQVTWTDKASLETDRYGHAWDQYWSRSNPKKNVQHEFSGKNQSMRKEVNLQNHSQKVEECDSDSCTIVCRSSVSMGSHVIAVILICILWH